MRRVSWLVLVVAVALGVWGAWQRQDGANRQSYLLDVLGWFLAVGFAVITARIESWMQDFDQRGVRRRSFLNLLAGVALALGMCVMASVANGAAYVASGASGLLIGGVGLLLAGLLTQALTSGAEYAARKIEERGGDPW